MKRGETTDGGCLQQAASEFRGGGDNWRRISGRPSDNDSRIPLKKKEKKMSKREARRAEREKRWGRRNTSGEHPGERRTARVASRVPEEGKKMVDARPVGSQAHHGCSPDPLHAWLPIASDSAVASCAASASTWWSSPSLVVATLSPPASRRHGNPATSK